MEPRNLYEKIKEIRGDCGNYIPLMLVLRVESVWIVWRLLRVYSCGRERLSGSDPPNASSR